MWREETGHQAARRFEIPTNGLSREKEEIVTARGGGSTGGKGGRPTSVISATCIMTPPDDLAVKKGKTREIATGLKRGGGRRRHENQRKGPNILHDQEGGALLSASPKGGGIGGLARERDRFQPGLSEGGGGASRPSKTASHYNLRLQITGRGTPPFLSEGARRNAF